MALSGAMTRKYRTALTFTETLSREMTSWLGTSMVTTRKSTRTICCTTGTTKIRPGPLTFVNLPRVNMTPRWYSRNILIALMITRTRMITMAVKQTRSEEQTSELQSLMRTKYAVFCFKKKN